MRTQMNYSTGLGKPISVLYKSKWRKIIWKPSIIVYGKVIALEDIFLPSRLNRIKIKQLKGGRNND